MSHYKVLFLDIDGTTIKPDDTIEESTKLAVSKVQGQGVEVFWQLGALFMRFRVLQRH